MTEKMTMNEKTEMTNEKTEMRKELSDTAITVLERSSAACRWRTVHKELMAELEAYAERNRRVQDAIFEACQRKAEILEKIQTHNLKALGLSRGWLAETYQEFSAPPSPWKACLSQNGYVWASPEKDAAGLRLGEAENLVHWLRSLTVNRLIDLWDGNEIGQSKEERDDR